MWPGSFAGVLNISEYGDTHVRSTSASVVQVVCVCVCVCVWDRIRGHWDCSYWGHTEACARAYRHEFALTHHVDTPRPIIRIISTPSRHPVIATYTLVHTWADARFRGPVCTRSGAPSSFPWAWGFIKGWRLRQKSPRWVKRWSSKMLYVKLL